MLDVDNLARFHIRLLRHTKLDPHTLTLINFPVKLVMSVMMAQKNRTLVDLHINLLITMAAKQHIKLNHSTATHGHTDVWTGLNTTQCLTVVVAAWGIASVKDVPQLAHKHTTLCRDT